MAMNRPIFRSAAIFVIACCFNLLLSTGCTWHGVRPIYDKISLEEQALRAQAIVFAQPIQSRSLHYSEKIPPSMGSGPGTENLRVGAVEKVLKVRQVLKGPIESGSLLKIDTFEAELKGIPHDITNEPAIFFLKREGDVWRPLTDFGAGNTIRLPGFPDRPLTLPTGANLTSNIAVPKALIDALLAPRNATDWPKFQVMLPTLASDSVNLAWASGITAADPMFVVDRLSALTKVANPTVVAAAHKEIASLTGLCHELDPLLGTGWGPEDDRKNFLAGRRYNQPGTTPEERDRTFWRIKAFSCSKQSPVRARAEALLHRYYPDRNTIGCEICPAA